MATLKPAGIAEWKCLAGIGAQFRVVSILSRVQLSYPREVKCEETAGEKIILITSRPGSFLKKNFVESS